MIPNGLGQYNIAVRSLAAIIVPTTYYLMSGTTVVATLNGTQGVFENIPPGCYRVIICTDGDIDYYCCKDLRCLPVETGCCELIYRFYTDVPNPSWQFGDNTSSNIQNPTHEYTNVNTYPLEGTPQTTVHLSWGSNTIQSILQFPQGIWVGADCQDAGNSSALMNTINPALPVFPALSYQNRQISIKGSITMNQNYQFTGCDFCMHPGARIVSTANPLSFLANTTLHDVACKNQAWYGVEVQQGMVIGENAVFTGAYNAMRTPAGLAATPVYRFINCQFNRNYLGMNIASPVTFSALRANTFGSGTGMAPWPGLAANMCSWVNFINKPANPAPFAGIYARTPAGAAPVSLFLPPSIPFSTQTNVFINLSNGIYLQDASATVTTCRFENMIPGAYPGDDGFGIALFTNNVRRLQQWGLGKNLLPLTFDNCLHAIYVDMNPQFDGGGDVLLRSFNNNMDVTHAYTLIGAYSPFTAGSIVQNNNITYTGGYGLLVQNASPATRLVIERNRVETAAANNETGIFLFDFNPQPLGGDYRVAIQDNVDDATNNDGIYGGNDGIDIRTTSNNLVQNNTISDYSGYGIYNLLGVENDIRCNNVFSAASVAAIRNSDAPNTIIEYNQTDASAQGIEITSACNNTAIPCNTFGSHDTGLYYDASAVTGPQQPDGTSAGNVWVGNYTTWAAFNGNINFANSRYFFINGEINPAQIFPAPPLFNWFQPVIDGINCAEECPPNGFRGREETELDNQIADGSLDPGGLPGYMLKRHLFNDLLYYPDLLPGNSNLQQFHASFGATNGGKLVAAEKAMADAFRLAAQEQAQWDAAKNDLNAFFDQWAVLDSLVQAGHNAGAQQTQRENLAQTAVVAEAALNGIYAGNLAYRAGQLAALKDILDSVGPQTQWESNEKTLNEIYLHTAFIDLSPDSLQVEEILQIAKQCLTDGGPAVPRARAWYFALTGTRVEVECNGVMERGLEGKQSNPAQLTARPNPVQDKVSIQFPGVGEDISRLEVYDVNGKLQHSIKVSKGITEIDVSTAGWLKGIYFCRLITDGQAVATGKFLVQH